MLDLKSLKPSSSGVKAYSISKGAPGGSLADKGSYLQIHKLIDVLVLTFIAAFLLGWFPLKLLLLDTTPAGGDTASHFHTAKYLADYLLPQGRLVGWFWGNYAGFPLLEYYFPLPFAASAALSLILPLTAAFKVMTVAGIFALPLCAYGLTRLLGAPFPAPAAAAGLCLSFLFNTGNVMWGANIASTLAGEFCYSIGFALAVLWLGMVWRAFDRKKGFVACAAVEAVVGLCHAYALLFIGIATVFFLFTKKDFKKNLAALWGMHSLAFCLMGFWILPLMANLEYSTKFSILWIFSSWGSFFEEVFPALLWPGMALALACFALALANRPWRRKGFALVKSPLAFLFFLCALGYLLYLAGYRAAVVDVRFLPFFQFFLVITGAWIFTRQEGFFRGKGKAALALAFILLLMVFAGSGAERLARWTQGNYKGFEKAALWPEFAALNQYLSGSFQNPRVAYEHSMINAGAGSVRAFESLPLFSGRSTLEGLYIQASVTAPFVFYLQSEISQKPSTPIPDFCYSRFNLDRAHEHLALFNVSQVIAVERETKDAMRAHPDYLFEKGFGPFEVFGLANAPGRLVEPLANTPVLAGKKDFRKRAYQWFRLGNLGVIPVFADSPHPDDEAFFVAPQDLDMRNLPIKPLPEEGVGLVETVENERIVIQNAPVGVPLLIKASFHKAWRVEGAERIYLAGPGFMLVIPKQPEVTLFFGPVFANRLGLGLTLLAIVLVALLFVPKTGRLLKKAGAFVERKSLFILLPPVIAIVLISAVYLAAHAKEFPASPFNKGIEAFRQKDYIGARAYFEKVEKNHPQSLISGEAAYHHAMTFFNEGDWQGCLGRLLRLVEEYPDAGRIPEVWYHLGLCYQRLGKMEDAAKAFEFAAGQFGDTVWGGLARTMLERE
ncbi:MAG: 6-pyruvoyl-tetrahydropterin synthase-related protein [Desulfatibacillaceae bacterium]|nr:6-pyruvoyl-tetrahydropterin synthase-related protein [Desulfatibacillaceae bacterium]